MATPGISEARLLGLGLALALPYATTGCMDFGELVGDIELGTHVDDWRDQVIYQVLVDRFADGDTANNFNVDLSAPARWHGGDWAGLEASLGYLQDLGVTALWISPVVKNVETDAGVDGYHGYWTQDFNGPNPHFGDILALRSLVHAAHERGLLVIVDIVTNHMGQLFYYDVNLNGQPDEQVWGNGTSSDVVHINEYDPDFDPRGVQAFTSLGEAGRAPIIFTYDPATNHMPPMPGIFQRAEVFNRKGRTLDFDDPDQLLHGDFPGGLKDLDTSRCDVKRAFVDILARWVELTDVDGLRIDTLKHVEREFWRYFTQKLRQRLHARGKKRFFMFGEAFDGRAQLVGAYTKNDLPSSDQLDRENECVTDGRALTGDQVDGVFHFPQYYSVVRDVFLQGLSTDRAQTILSERTLHYGTEPTQLGTGIAPYKTLVNFLDNHDVGRFLFWPGASTDALHLALLFVFAEEGIPCVYYGTEQRFSGGNDPANREDMWWSGYDESGSTFQWIQRLSALRRSYVALRRGDTVVRWASEHVGDESDAGILAFERTGADAGNSYALVVLNVSRAHASSTEFDGAAMITSLEAGTELVDLLASGRPSTTVGADGTVTVTLEPLTGALLVPADQVVAGT